MKKERSKPTKKQMSLDQVPGLAREESGEAESPSNKRKNRRSQTIAGGASTFAKKTSSLRHSGSPPTQRQSGYFKTYVDVTTPFTEPADLPSLDLETKDFDELLQVLKKVHNILYVYCQLFIDPQREKGVCNTKIRTAKINTSLLHVHLQPDCNICTF